MRKTILLLLLLILSLLIMSCWDNSFPTSDKTKTFVVKGSVLDKNGTGLEDVTVLITGKNFNATDATDVHGVFSFKGIPSGSYNIKTTVENKVFKPSGIDVNVSDSDIDSLHFKEAENRVHGQVMDIITNNGIPDIKIYIQTNHSDWDSTTTNSTGEYEFFDVPENEYEIYTDWRDNYKIGFSSPTYIYVKAEEFVNADISVKDFLMSSEVLQITSASYSKETNMVYLEWTPSKSNFFECYYVYGTNKLPLGVLGSKSTGGKGFYTNSAIIEITPKYLAPLGGAKIIHYSIYASYSLQEFDRITGPFSEPVTIKLAE